MIYLAVPTNNRVRLRGGEMIDPYSNHTRDDAAEYEGGSITHRVGTLETIINVLAKRLNEADMRGRIRTVKPIPLLRSVRILRRVLKT